MPPQIGSGENVPLVGPGKNVPPVGLLRGVQPIGSSEVVGPGGFDKIYCGGRGVASRWPVAIRSSTTFEMKSSWFLY